MLGSLTWTPWIELAARAARANDAELTHGRRRYPARYRMPDVCARRAPRPERPMTGGVAVSPKGRETHIASGAKKDVAGATVTAPPAVG